ncbi:MAG: response regulator [Desulfovibrio sp.]|nr:response regulator [Desulfovibrio sp.]
MLRILIVDDSRYQRHLIQSCLEGLGCCRQAADGLDGVDLFREALEQGEPFDLVVMDILMPRLDGHAALARIRELDRRAGRPEMTKAIMLSSLDDPDNMFRAQFEAGAGAYLTKPFEPADMLEALRALDLAENPLLEET